MFQINNLYSLRVGNKIIKDSLIKHRNLIVHKRKFYSEIKQSFQKLKENKYLLDLKFINQSKRQPFNILCCVNSFLKFNKTNDKIIKYSLRTLIHSLKKKDKLSIWNQSSKKNLSLDSIRALGNFLPFQRMNIDGKIEALSAVNSLNLDTKYDLIDNLKEILLYLEKNNVGSEKINIVFFENSDTKSKVLNTDEKNVINEIQRQIITNDFEIFIFNFNNIINENLKFLMNNEKIGEKITIFDVYNENNFNKQSSSTINNKNSFIADVMCNFDNIKQNDLIDIKIKINGCENSFILNASQKTKYLSMNYFYQQWKFLENQNLLIGIEQNDLSNLEIIIEMRNKNKIKKHKIFIKKESLYNEINLLENEGSFWQPIIKSNYSQKNALEQILENKLLKILTRGLSPCNLDNKQAEKLLCMKFEIEDYFKKLEMYILEPKNNESVSELYEKKKYIELAIRPDYYEVNGWNYIKNLKKSLEEKIYIDQASSLTKYMNCQQKNRRKEINKIMKTLNVLLNSEEK